MSLRPNMADVISLGCRLNTYESEVLRDQLSGNTEDVAIVNTCAVTAEAVRQARQSIRRLRRERPKAKIVVTGCAAQIEPDTFVSMPEVDRVVGNSHKADAGAFSFDVPQPKAVLSDIMAVRETAQHLLPGFADKARAFIEIQNGCDHRCTFCIIPYGRGNSRSVPAGAIIEQVRQLVGNDYQEVVLTGVDLTSYGSDLPGRPTLGNLVQRILKLVPDLPRLRISSIDSIEADAALMEAITGDMRLMPHLHLSLQAGDNMILKRMKRRHTREDVIAFCEEVRAARPDMVFGADIIAGFPTETDAMFERSLALVDDCGLTFLHVFPYSAREGTPAARMPQLPKAVRKARAALLRAKGEEAKAAYFGSRIGSEERVLIERCEDGIARGHTESFAPITLAADASVGRLVTVQVTGVSDAQLIGDPVRQAA
ncbi:MAG: tRNA (N(6)-L-threonylcarbamoyladenosine(37)-C(2))-methylthiotransferase MtaB [Pseudomonadota bacterium]